MMLFPKSESMMSLRVASGINVCSPAVQPIGRMMMKLRRSQSGRKPQHRIFLLRLAPIAAAVFGLIGPANSAISVWSGAGDPDPPFWDLSENWIAGRPPLSFGDSVLLGAADTTIRLGNWNLTNLAGSGNLAVSGGSLEIGGGLDLGGLTIGPDTSVGGSGSLKTGSLEWQTNSTLGLAESVGGLTTVSGLTTLGRGGSGNTLAFGHSPQMDGDAVWNASNTLSIGGAGVSGGVAYGPSTVTLAAGKTLTVNGLSNGAAIYGEGSFINAGTVTVTSSSLTIATNFVNAGTLDVQAGTSIQLPAVFTNPGRLMGAGTFYVGEMTNAGHISPGESPGTLSLVGDLTQISQGVLDVELESPSSFDLLQVSGSTNLGGTLNIVCYADCHLAVGQSFKILDGQPNQLNGSFDNIALLGFATGHFSVVYDRVDGDVMLNVTEATLPAAVVPEPSSWAFLTAGLMVLSALRRRADSRPRRGSRK